MAHIIRFGQCFGHLFNEGAVKEGIYVHALTTPNKPKTTSQFLVPKNAIKFKCIDAKNVELNEAANSMNAMEVDPI